MKKNIFIILLLLCYSVGLLGQYGYLLNMYEPETIDARSEALGRSSILSSNDANYLFNNPALLSSLSKTNIQFNCRTSLGNIIINRDSEGEPFAPEDEESKQEYNKPIHVKFNGVSIGIPFNYSVFQNIKFGFGIGYRTYYDWGFNVHYERDDEVLTTEFKTYVHGGLNTLVFGGGFSYQEKIYGGISISLPLFSNLLTETEYISGSEIADSEMKKSVKGTFFTLSGSYKFDEKVTFATRLRTGFALEMIDIVDDVEDFKRDIIIPSELGFALEIKLNNFLKLYTEYLTRNLGDYEIESSYDSYFLHENSENGYSFRSGFEAGTNKILRCGFFMQSVPIYKNNYSDEYGLINDKKPLVESGFTIGYGTNVNPSITLNLFGAYSFLVYDEKYNDYYGDPILNEYFYSNIKFGCSMGYSF